MADSDHELAMHERDKWASDYAELMAESVETGRKLAEALDVLREAQRAIEHIASISGWTQTGNLDKAARGALTQISRVLSRAEGEPE